MSRITESLYRITGVEVKQEFDESLTEASHAKRSLAAVVTDVFKDTRFTNVKVTKERGGIRVDFDKPKKSLSEETADRLAQRIELSSGDSRISVYPDVIGDTYIIFDVTYLTESLNEARNHENDEVNAVLRKWANSDRNRLSKRDQKVLDDAGISLKTDRYDAPHKYAVHKNNEDDIIDLHRMDKRRIKSTHPDHDLANDLATTGRHWSNRDRYNKNKDPRFPWRDAEYRSETPEESNALRPYSDKYKSLKSAVDNSEGYYPYLHAGAEKDLDDFRASIPRRKNESLNEGLKGSVQYKKTKDTTIFSNHNYSYGGTVEYYKFKKNRAKARITDYAVVYERSNNKIFVSLGIEIILKTANIHAYLGGSNLSPDEFTAIMGSIENMDNKDVLDFIRKNNGNIDSD